MKTYRVTSLYFFAIVLIVSFLACAGSPDKSQKSGSANQAGSESKSVPGVEDIHLSSIDSIPIRAPLKLRYDNVIFHSFESTDQFKKDYPDAREDCKAAIMAQLQTKKAYGNVTDDVNQNLPGKSVLADMKIVDIRIASIGARIWGGVFAGNSHMSVLLELTDADSKEVLHKKVLSTTNNAMAAAWTSGATDQSLPSNLGTLMGEYIFRIVPGTK